MITEKVLIPIGGSDSHDLLNIPVVKFTAEDVKQILAADRLRRKSRRKTIFRARTDVRPECFSPLEWEDYKVVAEPFAQKRSPSTQETACGDCTLAFQTSNILYGRCWPENLRATPLGRLYHGEESQDE